IQFVFEDRDSSLVIGSLQFSRKPPFKARKQSLFYILHIDRSLVGGENYLFSVLVQVIEDMEKHILCGRLPREELYVVYNKYIYQLIEVNKVVSGVFLNRFYKLLCKLFG